MFTGIIESVGVVKKINKINDLTKIFIKSSLSDKDIKLGSSISINGACLTVSEIVDDNLVFDIVKETLDATNFNLLEISSKVNLERAMSLSARLDGHIVQGHIESVGEVVQINKYVDQMNFSIKIKDNQLKYCIAKGSIAINGISLTIASINENIIKIAIIPHTLENTMLNSIKIGDFVNIETDMLSKYIEKLINYNNV